MIVKVEDRHIKAGDKKPDSCPIALAIKDLGFKHVEVGSTRIRAARENRRVFYFRTGEVARRFVLDFDRDIKVVPCDFDLEQYEDYKYEGHKG